MADLETVQNTIRTRFKTQVATPESVLVHYDNAPFSRPESSIWIRHTILPGSDTQVTLGTTVTYRMVGVAVAQIFSPIEIGDKASIELARVIQTAFRRVMVSGVRFTWPYITRIGRTGNEYQINVTMPWRHDDVAA